MNSTEPLESKSLLDEITNSETARSEAAMDRVVDGLLRASASRSSPTRPDTAAEVLKQIRAEPRNIVALPSRLERSFVGNTIFIRSLATVAASLLLIVGLWWFSENLLIKPPATVEAYGDVVIRRGDRTLPVATSARLYHRDILETRLGARAIVRYAGERTYVNLRSGSQLRLDRHDGAKWLYLDHGSLLAGVATQPAGKPMTVETPQASIRVAGTQFRVRSDAAGSTLEVTEGKVGMTRLSDRYTLEVPAGCTLTLMGTRPPTLLPMEQMVLAHLRNEQIPDLDKRVNLAHALAVTTLTYEVPLDGSSPGEPLKHAVDVAHQAGFLFYARVDLQAGRNMNLNDSEFARLLQNRLASLVEEYGFDGIYFANPGAMGDTTRIANLLTPIHQHMEKSQPGTALMVGAGDSST